MFGAVGVDPVTSDERAWRATGRRGQGAGSGGVKAVLRRAGLSGHGGAEGVRELDYTRPSRPGAPSRGRAPEQERQ